MSQPLRHSYHHSPVGPLLMVGDERALHYLSFPGGSRAMSPHDDWPRDDGFFGEVRRQLDAYFAGELTEFTVTQHHRGTDFQKRVWTELQRIPYGATVSYGELAKRIGKPTASRAVGAANGANPLPIMTPCHRVIGSDKSLTGFGGGVETKRYLLALEQRDLLSGL